jgi:eukaryotic-like serine/threonine-protein kinase
MTAPSRLVGSRYELGELVGYGGMAEVHRGRDVRLGRDVAIKVLRADLARDQTFLNRFRREAQAAAGLNHPAIVSVYDTGEDHGPDGSIPFIVMEYVEGRTLRDILRSEGRLPARRAMEIAAEVCAALDFSHRNGIVHRDIKPANVMIARDGSVKVMDFGIARALSNDAATVTQTAAVIGTAQYLSPEQARGEMVDARSDVYSTGCLLYELVTGNPPFTGDSPVAVAYQHVRENAPVPSSVNPDVPRTLDSIVMKALAKNPLNRYQSAADMRADLLRALSDRPVVAESVLTDAERTQFIDRAATPPPVVPLADGDAGEEEPARSKWIWVALVAALLLVVGGAAYAVVALGKSGNPKTIAVPNVIGQTPESARQTFLKAGFVTIATPSTYGGACGAQPDLEPQTVTDGHVCTQTPAAGSKQTKDTRITFTTYKTPTASVPSVVGLSYAAAADALTKAGLKPLRSDVNSSQPAGTVFDQNPKGYANVAPGSTVTLSVSTGKVGIPNVVGQKVSDAQAQLSRAGWGNVQLGAPVQTTDKTKDGTVASQYPVAGSTFPQTQQITLTPYQYVAPTPTCTSTTPTPPASTTTSPTPTPPTSTPTTSTRAEPTTPRRRIKLTTIPEQVVVAYLPPC